MEDFIETIFYMVLRERLSDIREVIHMTIREELEKMERETLSPYATLSVNTKGREREEEQCDVRPVFQRDRDRILHCKAFRRLKNKTQVFLTPKGDHYRTRLPIP